MQVYSYVMTIIKNPSCAEEITQNTFFKAMNAKNSKFSELDETAPISTVDEKK